MEINEFKSNIVFKEDTHQYFSNNGKELTSVSKILSNYKNKFDPNGHIKRACAKRDGITVQEIQAKWDKERDDACLRGQNLHSQLEHFIKTGKILKSDDWENTVKQFSEIKFSGKLFSEIQLFNEDFSIAGTTDLIELLDDNTVNLGDYKQNKKINLKSKYKEKMLYPLDKYDECEFEIYTFQINLYSYMLQEHGYKTNKMTLYHFDPKTKKMTIYDIPKREKDTLKLLKHFKAMKDW